MTIVGPVSVTGVSDTVSRRRVFICRPTTRARGRAVRRPHHQGPGDARLSRQGHGAGHRRRDAVLPRRPAHRRLRGRHPPGAAVDPGQPAVRVPPRADAGARRRPTRPYRIADRRSGLAAVVLHLGHRARRAADGGGAGRPSCGRRPDSRPQVRRMLADPPRRGAVDALRQPVAAPAGPRRAAARVHRVPAVRRAAARCDAPRDRAVLRQHRARGSQRARPAARRLLASSTNGWPATTASPRSTARPSAG